MTKPGLKEKGSLLGKPFISYSSLTRRIQRHSLTSSNSQAGKDTKRRGDMENGETLGQWEDSAQCQRLESLRACANGMESELRNKQNKKTFPLLYGKLRNSV